MKRVGIHVLLIYLSPFELVVLYCLAQSPQQFRGTPLQTERMKI